MINVLTERALFGFNWFTPCQILIALTSQLDVDENLSSNILLNEHSLSLTVPIVVIFLVCMVTKNCYILRILSS